jgi:hypothetical protein
MAPTDEILGIVITDGEIGAVIGNQNNIQPWAEKCGKTVKPVHFIGPAAIQNMQKAIIDAGEEPPSDVFLYAIAILKYLEESGCTSVVIAASIGGLPFDIISLCQELKGANVTVYSTSSCDPVC